MREYELVYLVSDSVAEDKISSATEKVKKFITSLGGGKIKEENLGRRRLAYEVKKNEFATYIQLNFELEGSKIKELENDLKLTSEVIRHLLILQKAAHESILDEKIQAVGNEELEAVIGERSFEQIEGETEESRDLMAKRDKEEEEEIDATIKVENKESAEPEAETVDAPEDKAIDKTEAKTEPVEEVIKKAKTTTKTTKKKETVDKVEKKEIETTEVKTEKEPAKKPTRPKKPEAKDESERLKQLDEKLDQILGDDL